MLTPCCMRLMHERAVLLPCASQVFLTEYTKDSTSDQTVHILEVRDGIYSEVHIIVATNSTYIYTCRILEDAEV